MLRLALAAVVFAASASALHMAGPAPTMAVVFDVDGTLCDSFALGFGATNAVLARHGYAEIDAAAYHAGCVFTTPERMARHAVGASDAAVGAVLGLAVPRVAEPLDHRVKRLPRHPEQLARVGHRRRRAAVVLAERVPRGGVAQEPEELARRARQLGPVLALDGHRVELGHNVPARWV